MDKYLEQMASLVAPTEEGVSPWEEVLRIGRVIESLDAMLYDDAHKPEVPGSGRATYTAIKEDNRAKYQELRRAIWDAERLKGEANG